MATRIVAPLIPLARFEQPIAHLNPTIDIADVSYVVSIAEIAGVPLTALGTHVQSVAKERLEIIAALDFLFTGS